MKGAFPEELAWTAVVLMVVVVITTIGIIALIAAFGFSGKSPLSSTIDFIVLSNRPYALATALTYYKPDDRNFLEHAVEISYSSLENASSQNLGTDVADFLNKYELNYYSVHITKNEKEVADVSTPSGIVACGDNFEGFCDSLSSFSFLTGPSSSCGVGRVEISAGKNACTYGKCCKLDVDTYKKQSDALNIKKCGKNSEGFCNRNALITLPDSNSKSEDYCGRSVLDIDGTEACKGTNNGDTPICCVYGDLALKRLQQAGTLSSAQIPLLYKDGLGYAEITIG